MRHVMIVKNIIEILFISVEGICLKVAGDTVLFHELVSGLID